MSGATRTRYAASGPHDIAYQVLEGGPADLLLMSGIRVPIELMDEEPTFARFLRRLSSFARVIRFDQRGEGLSERISVGELPGIEDRAADAVAVLDAAGVERASVLAPFLASHAGIAMAALHPDRVERLILVNGSARAVWADDYPIGYEPEYVERIVHALDADATDKGLDVLREVAPGVADDVAFRTWFDRAGNLACPPNLARALAVQGLTADVRAMLPDVVAPTLLLARGGIERPDFAGYARYLHGHLPTSRLVELPGADTLYWVGDTRQMLDEVEEFLTGSRGGPAERVLATVLFTDIVGSTATAASMGDERWRDLLDRHDRVVRVEVERFRGLEVNTTGDGFMARFDSPGRAIECAQSIVAQLRPLGIEVRAGVHTGELELRGADVAGLGVHVGARVGALAGAGEVLVSSTVRDLVAGSGIEFEDRGEHELKGVPGRWRLFAVLGAAP